MLSPMSYPQAPTWLDDTPGSGAKMPCMTIFDRSFESLIRSQDGMFTTSQARAFGLAPRTLVHLSKQGVIDNEMRGLYRVRSMRHTDPIEAHRQLMRGVRPLYPDAEFAGVSAALAHGIPVWGVDLRRPVIRRPVDRGRGTKGVIVRRRYLPSVETEFGSTVPAANAVVEVAVDYGIQQGLVSADFGLHHGLFTFAGLADAVNLVREWPNGSRAVSMERFADLRSESVLESRGRFTCVTHDIAVIPQVEIRDPTGKMVARVDLLIRDTKVIIEFDGKLKYASGSGQVLWDEKVREDALRALGYVIVRLTWADIENPRRAMAKIYRALLIAA